MFIPDSVMKLGANEQGAWKVVFDKALTEGYDAEKAEAIAWSFVNRGRGIPEYLSQENLPIYWRYPLARPGTFEPETGGQLTLGMPEVLDLAEALNTLTKVGKTCSLIAGHGSEFSLGSIPAAMIEGEVCYGCLVYDMGWDSGIRTGAYSLSMEAQRDFGDPAYTGGKTFSIFPTAWAVLPANVLPALPPGQPLAASGKKENTVRVRLAIGAPDRGITPQGKEADGMDPKELEVKIATLEAELAKLRDENASLKAKVEELTKEGTTTAKERDDLKAAKEAGEVAARQAAFDVKRKALVEAEGRPGVREKIEAELDKASTLDEKERVLASFETVCAALKPADKGNKLTSGKEGGKAEGEGSGLVRAAKQIQADHAKAGKKITINAALKMAVKEGKA